MTYELNYGYVPNTVAPDGEPIDVYIIDVDHAIYECEADVIAIITCHDDVENKLVARVGDGEFTAADIKKMTAFQERWFETSIDLGSD